MYGNIYDRSSKVKIQSNFYFFDRRIKEATHDSIDHPSKNEVDSRIEISDQSMDTTIKSHNNRGLGVLRDTFVFRSNEGPTLDRSACINTLGWLSYMIDSVDKSKLVFFCLIFKVNVYKIGCFSDKSSFALLQLLKEP